MKHNPFFRLILLSLLICLFILSGCSREALYDAVIAREGQAPATFVRDKLQEYDLLICDDALHPAVEPYEFLCDYISQEPTSIDLIFLEVIPVTAQPAIDAFLSASTPDTLLLADAFQQDFNYGWNLMSYLDLFFKIWEVNQQLPEDGKIRIIGVDQPIYWEGLHNREDYNLFQKTLIGRDYFMYKTIMNHMDNFNSSKKGVFMTNTRHAYKCIRDKDGMPYWNAGTFFHEWHPGKSYSLRFHNMILNITAVKEVGENISTAGMERMEYSWVRMDKGEWDQAFARNDNMPVAIPLKGNLFGKHPYYGNHMMNVESGQTMADAYDALIFLKPLEETRFSAQTNVFCTPDFKKELEHRVKVIEGHHLDTFLKKEGCDSIRDYVEKLCVPSSEQVNPLVSTKP